MKKINFRDFVKLINDIDYSPGALSYIKVKMFDTHNKESSWVEAFITDFPEENLEIYKDGLLIWKVDPDAMELYDTIRNLAFYLGCHDNIRYYLTKSY